MAFHVEQILTQIVAFLLMFWILKKYAWKPLLTVMEERKDKIQSAFVSIENQQRDLDKLIADYGHKMRSIEDTARLKAEEGIQKGQQAAVHILEEAHREAKEVLERAKAEIEHEVARGKMELKRELVDIAVDMTEKIIHERLDAGKQTELLAGFAERARHG